MKTKKTQIVLNKTLFIKSMHQKITKQRRKAWLYIQIIAHIHAQKIQVSDEPMSDGNMDCTNNTTMENKTLTSHNLLGHTRQIKNHTKQNSP